LKQAKTVSRPTLAKLLTRRLSIIALVVFAINSLIVGIYYGSNSRKLDTEVIGHQIGKIEAQLKGPLLPQNASARALYSEHPQAYAFALVDRGGSVLDAMNIELIPPGATDLYADQWVTRVDGPETRLLVGGEEFYSRQDGLRGVFVMTSDPANLRWRAYLGEFYEHVWFPILPLIFLLIGTSFFLVRRGLEPISAAASWARNVQPGKSVPPPDLPMPAEIADLIHATERTIARLEEALNMETRRVAEIAHALRTPVSVLVARVDALPSGKIQDQLRADITALARTVQQVLASARVEVLAEQGMTATDLRRPAEAVVTELAPIAYEHGLELILTVPDGPVVVDAMPEAVELALRNLVENAILHGGHGPIEITVGPDETITVGDHGYGLPEPVDENLFKAFWRGPDVKAGGTGLGLAIVERLQRIQNAHVIARNRLNHGAEFQLRWPGKKIISSDCRQEPQA